MIYPLAAAFLIALASLSGSVIFGKRTEASVLHRFMVPIAVGVFLGVVFFELLPEAFHESASASYALAAGFLGFYVLAHLIGQYHRHHSTLCAGEHNHHEGTLILLGDAVHNFIDGIVIAVSFSISPAAGIAATAGLLLHEVPQEIAELAILLRAGYSRARALFYNFLSATSVILGTIVTLLFIDTFEALVGILIAVAAGNLLYIAASDLLPDLFEEHHEPKHFWHQFGFVLIGLVGMGIIFALVGEH